MIDSPRRMCRVSGAVVPDGECVARLGCVPRFSLPLVLEPREQRERMRVRLRRAPERGNLVVGAPVPGWYTGPHSSAIGSLAGWPWKKYR